MVAFHGSHVVVTGGTGALGTAVVGALRAAGAECHLTNMIASELEAYAHRDDPLVHITPGIDLADEVAVRRFYEGLPPLWASVHLAGGFAMSPVAETSGAAFVDQLQMNALSAFLCAAAAIRRIRERVAAEPGGAKGGRIVNVAARPALEPRLGSGMVAYTASKAAVAALTQAIAQETADEEIWVNAVAPSILDTPANRNAMPGADYSGWVAPSAVAEVITFLASPDNQVTRGAVIPVYGGA
ncbi:MAG: SDR family NAD(P)-dependent oxidoreductase [Alphaproteobacteria bacterium]|nr:SDR family NAD(P)-dependent oxidoreductase [Alphaproteobacteria bacterium]